MIRLCFITVISGLLVLMANSSTKRGISHWPAKFLCDDFTVLSNISWWYDWRKNLSIYRNHSTCPHVIDQDEIKSKYVPMIWSYYPKTEVYLEPYTTYVLGYNEPNHKKQASRTVEKAVLYWANVTEDAGNRTIVGPSAAPCTNDCISNTTEWFDDFFVKCVGCRVDYLATHFYSWDCDANGAMHFLKMLYDKYGLKIWLTEFGCGNFDPNPALQLNFMKAMLPRLEKADYIYRYAWFTSRIVTDTKMMTTAASLLKPNSSELTELGAYYMSYEYEPPVQTS